MKYGSQLKSCNRSSDDLGRFGLGMKAASLFQCRYLTVASKKDCKISAYVWDLDVIAEKKDWYNVHAELGKHQNATAEYLSLIFHRYLNGEGRNSLTIMVNNHKLTALHNCKAVFFATSGLHTADPFSIGKDDDWELRFLMNSLTMCKLETMFYTSEDGTYRVFTLNPDLQRRLDDLAMQHPEVCCHKAKGEASGVTYQVRNAAVVIQLEPLP